MDNKQYVQQQIKQLFPDANPEHELLQHLAKQAITALNKIAQTPWDEEKILKQAIEQEKIKSHGRAIGVIMGYSHRHLAKLLGVNPGTTGSAMQMIRKQLDERVEEKPVLQYGDTQIPGVNTYRITKAQDSTGVYLQVVTPSNNILSSRDFVDYDALDKLFNGRDNWVQLIRQWNLEADNDSELAASIYT